MVTISLDLLLDRVRQEQAELDSRASDMAAHIEEASEQGRKLLGAVDQIQRSWSGSWLGYHSNLYFADFDEPPHGSSFNVEWGARYMADGWDSRSPEDVAAAIEQLAGVAFDSIDTADGEVRRGARDLQTRLLVALAPIRDVEGFDNEAAQLDGLGDSYVWGVPPQKFVQREQPSGAMSRDSRAVSSGFVVPPHVAYRARVLTALSGLNAVSEFIERGRRLLGQIEAKLSLRTDASGQTASAPALPAEDSVAAAAVRVAALCRRFPIVARQLQQENRHGGRPGWMIADEYDVQDLLHALLWIDHADVRDEEATESRAGKSTRIDFLLKENKVAVEAKIASKSGDGKRLAEEISNDIHWYAGHSAVEQLVAFVYDPKHVVTNPVGFEADLNKLASTDLTVTVVVA